MRLERANTQKCTYRRNPCALTLVNEAEVDKNL